jgi:hypothetical protein
MLQQDSRSPVPLGLAFAGVVCIFGGEILCITGPLRYERLVHLICHTMLYAGIALVCVAAGLRWADRRRGPQ